MTQTEPDIPNGPPPPESSTHLRQLALQFAAVLVVLSLAWPYFMLRNTPLPWPQTAFCIGGLALLLSVLTHQAWWWHLIHSLFVPALWLFISLPIDPLWFLLAFFCLLLVFRGAAGGQIPLYFSSASTVLVVSKALEDHKARRFIDLGAGIGALLCPLARQHPHIRFDGIENAPIPWLIGLVRCIGLNNCHWQWGSFWQSDLSDYDVVYAFLSPAPMNALWEKAQKEMKKGSLFISNSFPITDVAPACVIETDDARHTEIYFYVV